MHELIVLVFTFLLFSLSAFSSTLVIENAKVSCVRYIDPEGYTGSVLKFSEARPELFFWDDEQAYAADSLGINGYELERSIYSDVLCGGYTPNIGVSKLIALLGRDQVKNEINKAPIVLEDGEKVWSADIAFVQK
jgi:hypothetical protein